MAASWLHGCIMAAWLHHGCMAASLKPMLFKFINCIEGYELRLGSPTIITVNDSEDAPKKKENQQCQSFLSLNAGNSFDEDEIECKRRNDDDRIEHLQHKDGQTKIQTLAFLLISLSTYL